MKHKLFLLLMVALLTSSLLPVSAQDIDCEIDVSKAFILLGQAQADLSAGEKAGALVKVSEARAELQRIEVACGTGTGEVEPVIHLETPTKIEGRIIMHSELPEDNLNELDGLAFVNGFDLSIFTGKYDFQEELATGENIVAAIYAGYPESSVLETMATFVENGGRLLITYNEDWTDHAEQLQDQFGVVVVDEETESNLGILVYTDVVAPSWMNGLQIGVENDNQDFNFNAYLMTPLSGGEIISIMNASGERERLMYFSTPDRSLTFMPSVVDGSGFPHYPFDDDYFEQFDNEQATLAMLEFLMGMR